MNIVNLFGELANDLSIKNLMQKFGRFSFDTTSQLRTVTSGSVSVSGSLTTLTTCTTANMSIGDMGKASAAQLQSAQCFYGTVGANFTRS
jgi:hypothetical protein